MKHINIRSFNSDDDQQLHDCYISKVGLTTFTTNKTEKATSVLRLYTARCTQYDWRSER